MTLLNGFADTPPRIIRTYNRKLEFDGYYIIDREHFGGLMWVSKKNLKLAATVPAHKDDTVLDNGEVIKE